MISRKKKRRLYWGLKYELLPRFDTLRALGRIRRWKERDEGTDRDRAVGRRNPRDER
jgi:hypothetical protein